MSGQTFDAGVPPTADQLTKIVYQNDAGVSAVAVTSGTDTTTSSSYANMAGTGSTTSFSFTKVLAATVVKVSIAASWVSNTAASTVEIGVLVDGTDYPCKRLPVVSGAGVDQVGWAYISGLAAGTYTIQARWRRSTGTGTPTRAADQWLCLSAAECT